MSDKPVTTMQLPEGYLEWLITLKNKIHYAHQQASRVVNQELIRKLSNRLLDNYPGGTT